MLTAYEECRKADCHPYRKGKTLLIAACAVEMHASQTQPLIANLQIASRKDQFTAHADASLLGMDDFSLPFRPGGDHFDATDADRRNE